VRDGEIIALKDVSFEAKDGEILGFVGKSGGGKSTLLEIIRGVESFDSGKITLDDLVVTPDSGYEVTSRQMNITAIHLQRDFALWTETALKNVVRRVYSRTTGFEVLPTVEESNYDEIYDEAMYYLRLVGLEKKALHLATILSGGEKQRLLIARQLAKKPRILLLDEPATMACPATKQEVLDTILKANKELGITILVVSHLPEIHQYLADRLAWLENGEIVKVGESCEILREFLSNKGPAEPLAERPIAKPIVRVRGLYKRNYLVGPGEVLNIKDLNLDINEGEITSLIGASGAGKTTVLKIIEGLSQPADGTIQFRLEESWVDMLSYSPKRMEVRQGLGIMYQEFALFAGETILEQISYRLGIKSHDVVAHAREIAQELGISDKVLDVLYAVADMPEEDARGALEAMGLNREIFEELFPKFPTTEALKMAEPIFKLMALDPEIAWKLPDQISGGERVRASLAILLAAGPRIIILDEPFGDIDPITLREVSNSIKRVNRELGTTVLLVSHHVDLVREISHRAMLLEDGAITVDGDPDEVCNAFVSRCGAAYLGHGEIDQCAK
jgi:methyl coenzyme M reductase system, component A2